VTWLGTAGSGATDVDRTLGLLPDAHARFRELYAALWNPTFLPPETLEMCRRRVALLLGAAADDPLDGAHGTAVSTSKLAALSTYDRSPLFSDTERACIAFAEQYVVDPHGLNDDDFARLRELLDASQIATLTLAVAIFDALTRFRLALAAAGEGGLP
jgi:alkylhydroperoxidase family enzyme